MDRDKFIDVATTVSSEKWSEATARKKTLYEKNIEIRTPFARDYTRILHSTAYRRLKHKTQVFFATTNDHICTRIEHVNHVNSVSKTIANFLGLNSELTDAISLGHDLGHAPFGHMGEVILKNLIECNTMSHTFWHEKNSLHFIDNIETLKGPDGKHYNLDLTYAVRDGIICHCGEVDENGIKPRDEAFDLIRISKPNEFRPFTWEGCVVKISDKIAYLGRDIEDAIELGILKPEQIGEIDNLLQENGISESLKTNNTVLIHNFIIDLCTNSNPDAGIKLSDTKLALMKKVKDFCYKRIYMHPKIERYKKFIAHLLKDIFLVLMDLIDDIIEGREESRKYCPTLYDGFKSYLAKYSKQLESTEEFSNILKIYDLGLKEDKVLACIDFISGMTDQYAIKIYKETIAF